MKKRKTLLILIAAAALCLAATGALAVRQAGKSNSISGETARKIACADADVRESDVTVVKSEFSSGSGIYYYYTMEFETADVLYRYVINARTGQIVEKATSEPVEKKAPETKTKTKKKKSAAVTAAPAPENSGAVPLYQPEPISLEEARAIALSDAGVDVYSAVFSRAMFQNINGSDVYRIDFYVSGSAEYSYIIDAFSGDILSKEAAPAAETDEKPTVTPTVRPTPSPSAEPTEKPDPENEPEETGTDPESSSEETDDSSSGEPGSETEEQSDPSDPESGTEDPDGQGDGETDPDDPDGQKDDENDPDSSESSGDSQPTDSPSPEPSSEPVPEPSSEPAPEPSSEPVPEPTSEPAPEPSSEPVPEPSSEPAPEYSSGPAYMPDGTMNSSESSFGTGN